VSCFFSTKIGYGRLRPGRMQLAHVTSNTHDAGACIDGLRDEQAGDEVHLYVVPSTNLSLATVDRAKRPLDTEHTAGTKEQGNTK
jgi:hypothetical protein